MGQKWALLLWSWDLKFSVSQEGIDGVNWFLDAVTNSRKLKVTVIAFGGSVQNGAGHGTRKLTVSQKRINVQLWLLNTIGPLEIYLFNIFMSHRSNDANRNDERTLNFYFTPYIWTTWKTFISNEFSIEHITVRTPFLIRY